MAKGRKPRRGISIGTILMLAMTVVVLGLCAVVLPKLQGDTVIEVDTAQMLSSLTLEGALPELSLADIPITIAKGSVSSDAPASTPVPTLQPEVLQNLNTAEPRANGAFTMTLGGSICVESAVRKSVYYSETETWDFEDVMTLLAPETQSDLTLVSFENLIAPTAKNSDTVAPESALNLLTTLGVDVVASGFTEAFDQGLDGITSTVNAIAGRGMSVVGAYASQAEASPLIRTVGGVKVALLHYTDGLSRTGTNKMKNADAAYAVPQADPESIAADIASARALGAQFVVVSLHWGSVGKTAATKAQLELAQQIADAGADVIAGVGTKIIQPVVWLTGKDASGAAKQVLCAYNLGTLLSDDRDKSGYVAGMLLQLTVSCTSDGKITFDKTEYTPTYPWRFKTGSQWQYRVLASDQTPPDAMAEDQRTAMTKALNTAAKELADSVVTVRSK